MNIRFTGFGGQGIVLSGVILGWAAILDGKNAIQTQSYGSEARGGSCKCDVIIQDTEIFELEPAELDILLAFSQPAYDKYIPYLKADGTLIFESDLVNPNAKDLKNIQTYSIPATDIAFKKMKHRIMANLVMLGQFVSSTGIVSRESMEKSIGLYVPAKMKDDNIKAFKLGMQQA